MDFKSDLGMVPFHLGCNALVKHPNCAICNPVAIPVKVG